MSAMFIWNLLLASDFASAVCRVRRLAWVNIEESLRAEPDVWSWRYSSAEEGGGEDRVVTFFGISSVVLTAKAMFVQKLPAGVSRNEVADFLPTPGIVVMIIAGSSFVTSSIM
jgi:hypothetical protein